MIEQYFFELLQVAIGNKSGLSDVPSAEEWQALYELSKKQALVGITFKGCEKLLESQRPPLVLFLKWLGMANRVKERNAVLNQECCEVTEELENAGIHSVVLKGQSNRVNYGEELCDYRTPGDIDLWTWADEGGVGRIVEYTKQHRLAHGLPVMPWHRILYYHVESQTGRGTEIELHYRPSYLNCLWRNRRLQRWFDDERLRMKDERLGIKDEGIKDEGLGLMKDEEMKDEEIKDEGIKDEEIKDEGIIDFPIPSNSFNAVYQLLHIYKHLFEEGIGLRQILDYYFVIKRLLMKDEGSHAMNDRRLRMKDEIMNTLVRFGMKKFTGAMMYVLQTVFAMPDVYLLCPPNEKEGKFLLDEIMQAGNFGKYDDRIKHDGSQFSHAIEKTKHNLRLLTHYPEEVLWEPFFRVYHWIWRRFELWRY